MFSYFMDHQLITFIIVCASVGIFWKSLPFADKVFGDEDYSGLTWVLSLVLPGISIIAAVFFSILFLLPLFFN